jgi:hypothetical protein
VQIAAINARLSSWPTSSLTARLAKTGAAKSTPLESAVATVPASAVEHSRRQRPRPLAGPLSLTLVHWAGGEFTGTRGADVTGVRRRRHERLDLFAREPRGFGLDLDARRCELGERVEPSVANAASGKATKSTASPTTTQRCWRHSLTSSRISAPGETRRRTARLRLRKRCTNRQRARARAPCRQRRGVRGRPVHVRSGRLRIGTPRPRPMRRSPRPKRDDERGGRVLQGELDEHSLARGEPRIGREREIAVHRAPIGLGGGSPGTNRVSMARRSPFRRTRAEPLESRRARSPA